MSRSVDAAEAEIPAGLLLGLYSLFFPPDQITKALFQYTQRDSVTCPCSTHHAGYYIVFVHVNTLLKKIYLFKKNLS